MNGSSSRNNNNPLSQWWQARRRLSKYTGVVPQANGTWGAQIYSRHRRSWLGIFKTEIDAAMAYDSATLKLRSRGFRNLPTSSLHLSLETRFQSHYSDTDVLEMIKDGSYPEKLRDFCKSWQSQPNIPRGGIMLIGGRLVDVVCKDYFEKELLPSDVGSFNRLVIPKKFAVKFFPEVDPEMPDGLGISQADLNFYDRAMRRWTFKYCYWKGSNTYVITKGWDIFVQEKGLKAKDVLVFCNFETRLKLPIGPGDSTVFSIINFRRCADTNDRPRRVMGVEDGGRGKAMDQVQQKGIRLFGVDIVQE